MLLLNNYTLPLYRLGAAEARDLPQNPQNSQNLLLGKNLQRNPQNSQNLLAERRLPQMSQIFTDAAPPKN